MTTIVACLRIYLLYVLLLCQINPKTIHCSIIFWLSFGHVFAVSHFEKDYCINILIVCCRDLFNVVKPEKKNHRGVLNMVIQTSFHTCVPSLGKLCLSVFSM